MVYNIDIMAKRFNKRITRKTRIKLSPKDAEHIIKSEFTDDNGNHHILDVNFRPHSPFKEGDMKLKYKQGEN